jgi:hypothetical protein
VTFPAWRIRAKSDHRRSHPLRIARALRYCTRPQGVGPTSPLATAGRLLAPRWQPSQVDRTGLPLRKVQAIHPNAIGDYTVLRVVT